jgi:2-polyprenyl-3-methyl-5-hydroxy-6-metoxy-1,4-benzoquinol methylase
MHDRSNYLEEVVCDLCGSGEYKIIYPSNYQDGDFEKDLSRSFLYASGDRARGNIVKCRHCSLVYATPRDKNISGLYQDGADDDYYLTTQTERKASFTDDLLNLETIIGVSGKKGKLLDVGCSYGFFIELAQEKGWEVCGIELAKKPAAYAARKCSHIFNKSLADCQFSNDSFDVVTAYDLIEHLTSPTSFLGDVDKILKKDGWLVINTPNFSSWSSRILGRYWHCLIRMHLYYFTPKTIAKLLAKNNFKVAKITSHKIVVKLGDVVQWSKKYPWMYNILNACFNNRLMKDIRIKTSFGGNNMVVYAKKIGT